MIAIFVVPAPMSTMAVARLSVGRTPAPNAAARPSSIGKVFMMEEGLAAAFGAGVLPTDKRATAIVDIGAGTTNIAIIAKGSVVHSTSDRHGSNAINDSLATHLRRHRGLQVGMETTEFLKTTFCSAFLPDDI